MKEITLESDHIKAKLLIEELKLTPFAGEIDRFAIVNKDVYVPLQHNNVLSYSYIRILKGMVVAIVKTNEGGITKDTKFQGCPFRSRNILVYVMDSSIFHMVQVRYTDLTLIKE